MSDSLVCTGLRIEDIQKTVPAADVDTMAFGVHKYIIGIPARFGASGDRPISHGEYTELGGITKHHNDLLCILVERHREIAAGVGRRPACRLSSGGAIHDCDGVRIRDVREYSAGAAIELETLRMALQGDVGDLTALCGVDHSQRAIAIGDENLIGRGVDANVVRVIAQIDAAGWGIVCISEQQHRSVAGVRHVECVRRLHVADALWLPESGYPANKPALLKVDYSHTVIAKLGHE